MQAIAEAFEADSGHELTISPGSSGRLYAQIVNGAPYDLFFSADQEKPQLLIEAGLANPQSRFTYATGSLVLWWRITDRHPKDALDSLTLNKLAMANPRLAPYGAAASQVLEALALTAAYQGRIVMGENINQTFQFVISGNVDAGFIAQSQLYQNGELTRGTGWVVPSELHDPIRQDAVIISSSKNSEVAEAFMAYLQSAEAVNIISGFGYQAD